MACQIVRLEAETNCSNLISSFYHHRRNARIVLFSGARIRAPGAGHGRISKGGNTQARLRPGRDFLGSTKAVFRVDHSLTLNLKYEITPMKWPATLLPAALLFTSACLRAQQASQTSATKEQIYSVLCAIDQNRYEAAQKTLEQLLASDPKNADYQKALVGVQARQVKRGDHSAQNVALIRKTIEGYDRALKNLQLTTDERRRIDKSLTDLYGELGDEEIKNELLKRATDSQRAAQDRKEAYVVLAAKSWDCSFRITSAKNPDRAVTEKAQTCTNEGLRYVNEALALDPDDESAWSYKSNLLQQAAALAGLRNDQAQKAVYEKQYNEAVKVANLKAKAQRDKETPQSEETSKNDSYTTEEAQQDIKDLSELHLENSFDRVASDLLTLPFDLVPLVAPRPIEENQSVKSPTPASTPQQQYAWKSFAANDDLTMDLPENVQQKTGGSYAAASDGVTYGLMSIPRHAEQTQPQVVNGILNTMARTQAQIIGRLWLGQALGNRYELKFIRSEDAGGEQRKIFAYSLISCGERKEGVMVIQASRAHYYMIDINGAGESDPRAQRVLTSIKVK